MQKTLLGGCCALVSIVSPIVAHAGDPTQDSLYSYAQAAYIHQDLDTDLGDDDTNGFGLAASWQFAPRGYVFGRGDLTSPDKGDDFHTFSLGVGYRQSVADIRSDVDDAGQIDAYVQASYENLEYETSLGLDDTDIELDGEGIGATFGLRWLATSWSELNPYVGYVNYGDPDLDVRSGGSRTTFSSDETLDGIRYGLRGVLDVTSRVSLIAGFERNQLAVGGADIDYNTIRAGVRWYFPSHGITVR